MPELLLAEIEIRELHKSFASRLVLDNLNLKIAKGDLTVLIGPSGCGKSTLLRCLNGLEAFDSGTVRINGYTMQRRSTPAAKDKNYQSVAHRLRQQVGMVFQSFNLFPHLTLIQNVQLAPRIVKKISKRQATDLAQSLLEKVGLAKHAGHYPAQLSGGQQQRGAIARALAMEPQVMLYDEPTSSLDPSLTDEVWQVMRQIDQEGLTQIVVTHEYRSARALADRIIFIDQGRVVEDSTPDEIFTSPREERTREFLKHELSS